jgi:hypothetical protein
MLSVPKLIGLLALLCVGACRIDIPQGQLGCRTHHDCPITWSCDAHNRCVRATGPRLEDGPTTSQQPDAAAAMLPVLDAGPTDGAPGDATVYGLDASADAGEQTDAAQRLSERELGAPCSTPLEKICRAHASVDKLICLGGVWSFNGSCDGETRCDSQPGPTQGTCQAIAPLCVHMQPLAAVCIGTERKRCDEDLLRYQAYDCGEHARCANDASGRAACVCDAGYAEDATGTCRNVDDCMQQPCAPGMCVDGIGSYSCVCPAGYSAQDNACKNIDDCAHEACAPGRCVDGVGSYSCECPPDFRAELGRCVQIDDCTRGACDPGQCQDGVGTFSCNCPSGYMPSGTSCIDIDECQTDRGGCVNRACINQPGTRICGECDNALLYVESPTSCAYYDYSGGGA